MNRVGTWVTSIAEASRTAIVTKSRSKEMITLAVYRSSVTASAAAPYLSYIQTVFAKRDDGNRKNFIAPYPIIVDESRDANFPAGSKAADPFRSPTE
jgi:hypothetical protein